jgi:hypothetical protein
MSEEGRSRTHAFAAQASCASARTSSNVQHQALSSSRHDNLSTRPSLPAACLQEPPPSCLPAGTPSLQAPALPIANAYAEQKHQPSPAPSAAGSRPPRA